MPTEKEIEECAKETYWYATEQKWKDATDIIRRSWCKVAVDALLDSDNQYQSDGYKHNVTIARVVWKKMKKHGRYSSPTTQHSSPPTTQRKLHANCKYAGNVY